PARGHRSGRSALADVLSTPRARWILSVTCTEGAFAFGAIAFVPSLLQRHHDVSLSMAGGIAACYVLAGSFYARVGGRLRVRIGVSGLARLGGALLCLVFLSLAYVPPLAWAPVVCTLPGFAFYCLHNTLQTYATQIAHHARGVAMSL